MTTDTTNPVIPPTTPAPVNPASNPAYATPTDTTYATYEASQGFPQTGTQVNTNNGSTAPTAAQSQANSNPNPNGANGYGTSTYNPATNYGITSQTTANAQAPFGSNAQGVPYGSQYSNNPNPNASVYNTNQNTNGNTNGTVNGNTNSINSNGLSPSEQQYEDTINGFNTSVQNILNGTTPLTASEQAQVQGLQTQYQQLIDKQNLVNTNDQGSANIRGYQSGAAEYDPTFQAKTIGSIVSAGQTQIANLQTAESSAVAQLTESLQQNDVKGIQSAYDMYTSSHKDVADAIQKTVADTQAAIQDAHIANVLSSGITNPSDILKTLQSQGYTDISAADITSAIKNLSPDAQNILAVQKAAAANGAPQSVLAAIGAATNQADALTAAGVYNTTMIPDLQKTAEANGAPQSVIDAIGNATDSNSALQAAAGYTQTASGTLGDYLEYQRQAIAAGQVPEDYSTYEKAQQAQTSATAIKQAVSIADQEAAYKAQVDTANGVLTSAQNTRVNDVVSQLNSNKDVQAFMSIAGQLPNLQSIPAGTTDPAQQTKLLTTIAHILSPNSSSLRGALNAVDPNSLNSGVYNVLNAAAKTVDARGTLSSDAVNKLIQIGTDEYNNYLGTYQAIRDAATAPLSSQGIDVNSYIPDYSSVNSSTSQTLQQQSATAANLIQSFGAGSSSNAAILKNLAQTMPNATTLEIAQTLGLISQ